MTLDISKDTVTQSARFFDVPGTEGESQALCGSVGLVHRYMAPPYTAVVPQVVVKVVIVNTKRDFGLLRCHFLFEMLSL